MSNTLTLGAANATEVRAKTIEITFMFETSRLNVHYIKIRLIFILSFCNLYAMFLTISNIVQSKILFHYTNLRKKYKL